jgi:hypothetical protein
MSVVADKSFKIKLRQAGYDDTPYLLSNRRVAIPNDCHALWIPVSLSWIVVCIRSCRLVVVHLGSASPLLIPI